MLASGYAVDVDRYHEYAVETARLLVAEYGWYKLPPTVHKVLVHGSVIIASLELPIGMYSEEASEAQNKHYKCVHFLIV